MTGVVWIGISFFIILNLSNHSISLKLNEQSSYSSFTFKHILFGQQIGFCRSEHYEHYPKCINMNLDLEKNCKNILPILEIIFFLLSTECSIWSSGDTSDVMGYYHFTEYSMTSEHHWDITVQTEAKCHCYQIRLNLNKENGKK